VETGGPLFLKLQANQYSLDVPFPSPKKIWGVVIGLKGRKTSSATLGVYRTLPLSEKLHQALVFCAGRGKRVECPELTGVDAFGKPLKGPHEHAHILPLDLDGDEKVELFLVWASMGLGEVAQNALATVQIPWNKGTVFDLRVFRNKEDLWNRMANTRQASERRNGEAMRKLMGCFHGGYKGACLWKSLTPFVPPRYLKRRGNNSLEGQIQAELASRGFPRAESIEVLEGETEKMGAFIKVRSRGNKKPPVNHGFALRIELRKPLLGPLCLGYASHFGMGVFQADSGVASS